MMSHGFDPNRLERIGQIVRARYVDSGVLPGALTLIWRKGAVSHLSIHPDTVWRIIRL